jgi:hypothetical protein
MSATPPQQKFLTALINERRESLQDLLDEGKTVDGLLASLDTDAMNPGRASRWITRLLDIPKDSRSQQSAGENPEPDAGMYKVGEKIVRVYFGQQSHRMLAKELVESDEHDSGWDWAYMGAASRFVAPTTPKLSIEEAAKFGRMTGTCAVCARRLDVPESVDRGIGPVCFGRLETGDFRTAAQKRRDAEATR